MLPLLSRRYRALAPDQRGHGDSDNPGCCYASDEFTADVDAVMDAVGIEGATLVGDSSGGRPANGWRSTTRAAQAASS